MLNVQKNFTQLHKMVTIVGLGAVGAVYASALHKANIPLNIALDPERLIRYGANPLIFNNETIPLNYFTPSPLDPPSDYILICTKSTDYASALKLIEPLVGHDTKILPLLNGISSEKIAQNIFNPKNILYGYFIGHTASRNGRHISHDGICTTIFGEKLNDTTSPSQSVEILSDIFNKANLKHSIEPDMITALWQKFTVNIALNQTTAYFNKNYGEIKQSPEAIEFMQNLVAETILIAQLEGISNHQMEHKALQTLKLMRDQDCSSMLQDIRAGRETEIDIFAGEIIRLAQKHNVDTPYNSLIIEKLK